MGSSKSYTVAWDERKYVSDDFSDQMDAGNLEYVVWDVCSTPVKRKNWQVAEKVRYYGHFYNSLKDFVKTDHELFIFSAGDILCDDFVSFVHKAEKLFQGDEDIWILSPHLPTDEGSGIRTAIEKSTVYEDMLLSIHVNGLYVVLRRELAVIVCKYFEWLLENKYMNFSTMITGHCLDSVYCAWAIYNKKKIYRDMSTEMFEVDGTSYNSLQGKDDCNNIRNRFVEYMHGIDGSGKTIRWIFSAMYENETKFYDQMFGIKRAYQSMNSAERQEFTY